MNLLENYLLNQQNKPQTYNPSPLLTPEQFEQKKQIEQQKRVLAEKLMQQTSLMNGVQNLLIHPKNAIFGIQSNNQEVPISYNQQPIVGVDVTQQDYNNMQKQGLLPESPMMVSGIKENPRVGGLLQDFSSGFKENAQSKFNPSNLENNTTDYGGKKGLAYRIGEGAGSVGKFMASPAGIGLMTMAGVGLTGGNPTQAMTYGLQAGLGNYNNVQEDKMNRNLLQQQGIDTSNIRGYLTNDRTKSYTDNYNRLNNSYYRMGKLSIAERDLLRKQGYTEAQIDKIEAQTETEKERPALIKAQTGLTQARKKATLNPPVRRTINERLGGTTSKVVIEHKGGSNGVKTKTSTPKPTSGDYYF